MTRNPNATCSNCPYSEFAGLRSDGFGECRVEPELTHITKEYWCSKHPEFFNQEEQS